MRPHAIYPRRCRRNSDIRHIGQEFCHPAGNSAAADNPPQRFISFIPLIVFGKNRTVPVLQPKPPVNSKKNERACKAEFCREQSSISTICCHMAQAAFRSTSGQCIASVGVAPDRVCRATRLLCAGELLPRLSTLTAEAAPKGALNGIIPKLCGGISLLHFPWGHPPGGR